jgi:hypothetical protein
MKLEYVNSHAEVLKVENFTKTAKSISGIFHVMMACMGAYLKVDKWVRLSIYSFIVTGNYRANQYFLVRLCFSSRFVYCSILFGYYLRYIGQRCRKIPSRNQIIRFAGNVRLSYHFCSFSNIVNVLFSEHFKIFRKYCRLSDLQILLYLHLC